LGLETCHPLCGTMKSTLIAGRFPKLALSQRLSARVPILLTLKSVHEGSRRVRYRNGRNCIAPLFHERNLRSTALAV
jgi:hypothetical protein